jgi:hypothetical protein
MNPLSLASSIVRHMQNTLRGMQKQAPGARMVGEFAVRQALKEATKTVQNFQSGRASSADNEQSPDVKH